VLARTLRMRPPEVTSGGGFRDGLRFKGVDGARGIFDMTRADDGRAIVDDGDAGSRRVARHLAARGDVRDPPVAMTATDLPEPTADLPAAPNA